MASPANSTLPLKQFRDKYVFPKELTHVNVEATWKAKPDLKVDLNLIAFCFDHEGQLVDGIYYNKLLAKGMKHSGDDTGLNETGMERISFVTDAIDSEVKCVMIYVSCYPGNTISDISEGKIKAYGGYSSEQVESKEQRIELFSMTNLKEIQGSSSILPLRILRKSDQVTWELMAISHILEIDLRLFDGIQNMVDNLPADVKKAAIEAKHDYANQCAKLFHMTKPSAISQPTISSQEVVTVGLSWDALPGQVRSKFFVAPNVIIFGKYGTKLDHIDTIDRTSNDRSIEYHPIEYKRGDKGDFAVDIDFTKISAAVKTIVISAVATSTQDTVTSFQKVRNPCVKLYTQNKTLGTNRSQIFRYAAPHTSLPIPENKNLRSIIACMLIRENSTEWKIVPVEQVGEGEHALFDEKFKKEIEALVPKVAVPETVMLSKAKEQFVIQDVDEVSIDFSGIEKLVPSFHCFEFSRHGVLMHYKNKPLAGSVADRMGGELHRSTFSKRPVGQQIKGCVATDRLSYLLAKGVTAQVWIITTHPYQKVAPKPKKEVAEGETPEEEEETEEERVRLVHKKGCHVVITNNDDRVPLCTVELPTDEITDRKHRLPFNNFIAFVLYQNPQDTAKWIVETRLENIEFRGFEKYRKYSKNIIQKVQPLFATHLQKVPQLKQNEPFPVLVPSNLLGEKPTTSSPSGTPSGSSSGASSPQQRLSGQLGSSPSTYRLSQALQPLQQLIQNHHNHHFLHGSDVNDQNLMVSVGVQGSFEQVRHKIQIEVELYDHLSQFIGSVYEGHSDCKHIEHHRFLDITHDSENTEEQFIIRRDSKSAVRYIALNLEVKSRALLKPEQQIYVKFNRLSKGDELARFTIPVKTIMQGFKGTPKPEKPKRQPRAPPSSSSKLEGQEAEEDEYDDDSTDYSDSDVESDGEVKLLCCVIEQKLDSWLIKPSGKMVEDPIPEYIPDFPKRVVLEVLEAKELIAADLNGKSDPFIKIKLNEAKPRKLHKKQKSRTSVKKVTLEPVWNERFEFDVFNPEDTFIIAVMDWDSFKRSDPLGTIRLTVYDALKTMVEGEPTWYDVGPREQYPTGKVLLRITRKH